MNIFETKKITEQLKQYLNIEKLELEQPKGMFQKENSSWVIRYAWNENYLSVHGYNRFISGDIRLHIYPDEIQKVIAPRDYYNYPKDATEEQKQQAVEEYKEHNRKAYKLLEDDGLRI